MVALRFLILIAFCFNLNAFSQSERVIRFSVIPTDNQQKALVRWTMNAGSTCLDLTVERSSDKENYSEVYIFPGVCGSEDSAVSYSWVDPLPIAVGISYYRLKLDAIEFSLVSELELSSVLSDQNILAFPNPSNGIIKLEFLNPNRENYSVHIFDNQGKNVFEAIESDGNFYQTNLPFLNSGLYNVEIRFENSTPLQTKIIIR